jgi:hypothetical protein
MAFDGMDQSMRNRKGSDKIVAMRCNGRGRVVQGNILNDGIGQTPQSKQVCADLGMSRAGDLPLAIHQRQAFVARKLQGGRQFVGAFLDQYRSMISAPDIPRCACWQSYR